MNPVWWLVIVLVVVGVGVLVWRRGPVQAVTAILAFLTAIATAVWQLAGQFVVPPPVL